MADIILLAIARVGVGAGIVLLRKNANYRHRVALFVQKQVQNQGLCVKIR